MLMNLRNALMAGKRLPYDAEVEYLESTGTQWIDTGVGLSPDIGLRIDFQFADVTREQILFGALEAGVARFYPVWRGFSDTYWSSATNGSIGGSYGPNNSNRHIITNNYLNDKDVTLDGVVKWTNIVTVEGTSLVTNYLFARNYNNAVGYICSAKVFRCQVSVGTNVVRDFIPVRKGTVGYLYDRVSGKLFGNAGTGDFVVGPDVVPVEYIESHGTEWIDTGVNYFPDFEIHVDVPTNTRNVTLYSDASHYLERKSASDPVWQLLAGGTLSSNVSIYGYHQLHFRNNVLTIDGQTVGTMTNRDWGYGGACYIWKGSAQNYYIFTLFSCRLWSSDGTLVRSFLPVRVGSSSTWEGAMMDVLTRRIYRNQGTGAFTYGNDLKYPIPAE